MKPQRTDGEILADLIDAVIEYKACRDDEETFKEDNGDPELYDRGTASLAEELAGETLRAQKRLQDLIIEATDDQSFTF